MPQRRRGGSRLVPALLRVVAGMEIAADIDVAAPALERTEPAQRKKRPLVLAVMSRERGDVDEGDIPAPLDMAFPAEAVVRMRVRVAGEPQIDAARMRREIVLERG